jgi:aryl-alcohol dehydrogenase-like predicted oxidoreductase
LASITIRFSMMPNLLAKSEKLDSKCWSRTGLGTGTLASFGRAASSKQVDALLGVMLEMGHRVIDTADTYGSGDCEWLLGKALKGRSASFTIVTKAGYRYSDLRGPLRPLNQIVKKGLQRFAQHQSFEPSYLSKCLDRSLSRLGVEQVGSLLLHNPPIHVVTDEAVIKLMDSLIQSGKVARVGISSFVPAVIAKGIVTDTFRVIESPASLIASHAMRPLWNECHARGIHVIGNHIFDPACFRTRGVTHELLMRGSAALLPENATILCGTRNPAHLREAIDWAAMPLSEKEALEMASRFVS